MMLGSVLADVQFSSQILIGVAVDNKFYDLHLSRGKARVLLGRGRSRLRRHPSNGLNELGNAFLVNPMLPCAYTANAVEKNAERGMFQDDAVSPQLQHLNHLLPVDGC